MPTLASPDFQNALKTLYLDPLNDAVIRRTVLLDRINKVAEDVVGDNYVLALETARNPAIGTRADTSGSGPKLPETGRGSYSKATFGISYHYGRGSVSGPAMRKSRTTEGAWAKALDVEMRNLSKSLPEDLNRKLCASGNGRCATLASASGAQTTSTSITISSYHPFLGKVGDRVIFDHIAGSGLSPANGTTISAISRDTTSTYHTVTLAAASGATMTDTADALYFGANSAGATAEDTSRATQFHGIMDVVSNLNMGDVTMPTGVTAVDGAAAEYLGASVSFGGIERGANTWWQSIVLNNPDGSSTLRPFTIGLMMQAWLSALHIGGSMPGELEIYTTPGIYATWGLTETQNRIYNDYRATTDTGWEFINFNGSKVFAERDLPRDVVWFLNMSNIMLLTQGGYEFLDDDGNKIRIVDGGGRDAWQFTLCRDINLASNNCNRHVRVNQVQAAFQIEANL